MLEELAKRMAREKNQGKKGYQKGHRARISEDPAKKRDGARIGKTGTMGPETPPDTLDPKNFDVSLFPKFLGLGGPYSGWYIFLIHLIQFSPIFVTE